MVFAKPDYDEPSAGEIAAITAGRRYSKSRQGNQGRSWGPSKTRMAHNRRVVFTRDDFACQEADCGIRIPPADPDTYDGAAIYGLQLDHYPTPYRDGGLFYPGNLRTLCAHHNSSRGAGD